ncbi:hypothetical protein QYF36_008629 [Acer negundo]|nr:hypothetical protein QYF36_008629 [Acer negundo]
MRVYPCILPSLMAHHGDIMGIAWNVIVTPWNVMASWKVMGTPWKASCKVMGTSWHIRESIMESHGQSWHIMESHGMENEFKAAGLS